jgi:nicotinamidase/pyrazinamidase
VHCVAGSPGARFHPDLVLPDGTLVVSTGTDIDSDGYSAFDGALDDGTTLADDLRRRGITQLVTGGLATDYCVKHSVLDAIRQGWRVTVVTDAIAAVELNPGDGEQALTEMGKAGADLRPSTELRLLRKPPGVASPPNRKVM